MRSQFLLIPAALIAGAVPAEAKVFLNTRQAQQLTFPGASFIPRFFTLSEGEAAGLEKQSGSPVIDRQVQVWEASTGGWLFVDRVLGKDDIITYAVALTNDGIVKQVEILECLADYDTIRIPEWRMQFTGRAAGSSFSDIETISGTTLSSRHVTEGVKRIAATYGLLLKSKSL